MKYTPLHHLARWPTRLAVTCTATLMTLMTLVAAAPAVMAQPVAPVTGPVKGPVEGHVAFTADGRTYMGQHAAGERLLSVDIGGFNYRGHYQRHGVSPEPVTGQGQTPGAWGQAFLFASSAQVMRCQLNEALPQLRGTCLDSNGRTFVLTSSDPPDRP